MHSVCMRTASKVFDAMLGPHFSEGQPSNGGLPRKVSMPDDNAVAMTTICNVIHHRNDLAPDVPGLGGLDEIALAANKYDCVLALKYAMFQWLDHKELVTFSSLGRLLIAAYVFNNSDAFRRVTRRLITDFSRSYLLLIDTRFSEIIPSSICCKCIQFFQVIVVAERIARLVRRSKKQYPSQCAGRAPSRGGTLLRSFERKGLSKNQGAPRQQSVGFFAVRRANRLCRRESREIGPSDFP